MMVRLIGRGQVIWLVGGCRYASRSKGGFGQVWAYIMGKGWKVRIDQTDQEGMGDMATGLV